VAIDTTSSSQAGTISGTQVRELELVNRNFQQLVYAAARRVNLLGDEARFWQGLNSVSSISVNGARTTANNWSWMGRTSTIAARIQRCSTFPASMPYRSSRWSGSSYDASFGRSAAVRFW